MRRRIEAATVLCAVLALASCAKSYSSAPLNDLGPPSSADAAATQDAGAVLAAGGDIATDAAHADAPAELSKRWGADLLATLAAHPVPAGRTVTVLMPTDEAFAALTPDQASALLDDPDSLDRLVERHVLAADIPLEILGVMSMVPTLAGDDLAVANTGMSLEIGGAAVVDVAVTPGVAGQSPSYVFLSVDRVLLSTA